MAPVQKPGKSRQDYQTPLELIEAVGRRLNIDKFSFDLAASKENAVAEQFYTEEDDALIQPWAMPGWHWCNPPFGKLRPWVKKAWDEVQLGARVVMLVPAGVGSNWWKDYVHDKAHVLFLNGRLIFGVGGKPEAAPYPKDCAILLWTPFVFGGYEVWDWRKT